MFFLFYLSGTCELTHLKEIVNEILNNVEVISDTNNELEITTDGFNLSITEGGEGVQFRSEDYGMQFKFQFWFDIYNYHNNWAEQLMSFIGCLLNEVNEDCILESNGDTPILMRRNGNLVVDDKKLKGTERFPFYALNQHFVEGDIGRV